MGSVRLSWSATPTILLGYGINSWSCDYPYLCCFYNYISADMFFGVFQVYTAIGNTIWMYPPERDYFANYLVMFVSRTPDGLRPSLNWEAGDGWMWAFLLCCYRGIILESWSNRTFNARKSNVRFVTEKES